jgi:aromatic-L-amino-acid decarboxylase
MMQWLQQMIGLPASFTGVIQDTASTATLCALLTAREQSTNWKSNNQGMMQKAGRVYCSTETHSSIEKGVKIAGLGKDNLVKVSVDGTFRLDPIVLEAEIQKDLANGYMPLCVVATIGTTGVTAIDPIKEIGLICQKYRIWLHVDAAYAGTALILPEYRWMAEGMELGDSFVFNPHKWMLTNFDCTAYFVKNPVALQQTFEILPEYLKTETQGSVNNYRDWGIPLGRRFRALKLWFVMRSYGISGIAMKLRSHLHLAQRFELFIRRHSKLVLTAPRTLNLVCFGYFDQYQSLEENNRSTKELLKAINASKSFYVTHTLVHATFTIRVVIGQPEVAENHIIDLEELIDQLLGSLS